MHGSRKQELKHIYDEKKKIAKSSEKMKAVQDPEKRASTALHMYIQIRELETT